MAMNTQSIRRMLAHLRADPHVQAMVARNDFAAAAVSSKVLDLNSRSQDYQHWVAVQWCEVMSKGRWRRRVVERVRYARLDWVHFEFEFASDRKAFDRWRKIVGW